MTSKKAKDAAQAAAEHRLASEKEMCQWLTQVHSQNHLHDGPFQLNIQRYFSPMVVRRLTKQRNMKSLS